MAEGNSGNIWFSIGKPNPDNTITWGKQVPYIAGSNPSVSRQSRQAVT
jgi:hypothetical protein